MTIAFDFDGVIHRYSKGWYDGTIYDSINMRWIELTRDLLSEGHGVFILSTRPKRQIYRHMKELFYDNTPEMEGLPCENIWICDFGFRIMPFWEKFYKNKKVEGIYPSVGICNHKAVFDVLIEDRTICFKGKFSSLKEEILAFKPWGEVRIDEITYISELEALQLLYQAGMMGQLSTAFDQKDYKKAGDQIIELAERIKKDRME